MGSVSSTGYVSDLYSTILLRPGSSAEVAAWSFLLNFRLAAEPGVLAGFLNSTEVLDFVDPIIRLYQGFFDRAPDAAGLGAWVDGLRSGQLTLQQAAEGFAGAAEFTSRYGTNPDPTTFVTLLYANGLGRAPDSAGLAGWAQALTSHTMDYAQVALGFTQSAEYIADSAGVIRAYLSLAADNAVNGIAPIYPGPQLEPTASVTTLAASTTRDDQGVPADGIDAAGTLDQFPNGNGDLTSFADLASSATINLTNTGSASGAVDLGNVAATQIGLANHNSLSVIFDAGGTGNPITMENLTISGTAALTLVALDTAGARLGAITDSTGTLSNIVIRGTGELYIGIVTGTALKTIDASAAGGLITIGDYYDQPQNFVLNIGVPPPLDINGLTVLIGSANSAISVGGVGDIVRTGNGGSGIFAIGAQDTVIVGNDGNSVTSSGAADTIDVGDGPNIIIAVGAGDTINLGTGQNTVTMLGIGSTITVASGGGHDSLTVGSNAVANLSLSEQNSVVITGDVAGTPTSFNFTTIRGIVAGDMITFGNATNEQWLGGSVDVAQVDVTSATSLTMAVNLAVAQSTASTGGLLPASTGAVDWFQFGGNTYLVEALNGESTAQPHTALVSGDAVVELVGLVSPAGPFINHVLTI